MKRSSPPENWLVALPGELVRAVMLLIAFGCALAGILAWIAWFQPRLDFAANLAPFAIVAAILIGLIWLAQRERRPGATGPLALIAIVTFVALIVPEISARLLAKHPAPPAGETLKVVQLNVWEDDWSTDRKLAWLKEEDPDVILLEEVGPSSGMLLGKLNLRYPYVTACHISTSPCGVMILAKRRPTLEGSSDGVDRAPNLVWARYRSEGGDYAVAAVHLNWPLPDGRQRRQVERMLQLLQPVSGPALIVGGDFNASGWSQPIHLMDKTSGLTRLTRALPTFPAHQVTRLRLNWPAPVMPIDHIYAGPAWSVKSLAKGADVGSDHYPVVAVLVRAKSLKGNEKAPSGTP